MYVFRARLVTVLAIVATAGLTACSASTPSMTPEQAYVAQLRGHNASSWSTYSDDQIVTAGKQMCQAIDAGQSERTAITALIVTASQSDDPRAAAYAVGAAVSDLCPEHSAAFQAVTGSN